MRVLGTLLTAALALILPVPVAAVAQSSDPDADSPSGVVYQIPLDSARGDAAPSGGDGGSSRGGGTPSAGVPDAVPVPASGVSAAHTTSSIHSENGFGSSSTVPGATENKKQKDDAAKAGRGARSTDAGGGGAAAPGGTAEHLITASSAGPAPSTDRAYLLVALAIAVAAGLGFAGRHALRNR